MNTKDQILAFLRDNKQKSPDQRYIQANVLPELNEDKVKALLKEIILHNSSLVKYKEYENTGVLIVSYTGLIDEFLDNGGFTNIETQSRLESNKLREIEHLQNQVLKLQRDNLRLKNWDIRIKWLIAILSFVAGVVTKYVIDNNL